MDDNADEIRFAAVKCNELEIEEPLKRGAVAPAGFWARLHALCVQAGVDLPSPPYSYIEVVDRTTCQALRKSLEKILANLNLQDRELCKRLINQVASVDQGPELCLLVGRYKLEA